MRQSTAPPAAWPSHTRRARRPAAAGRPARLVRDRLEHEALEDPPVVVALTWSLGHPHRDHLFLRINPEVCPTEAAPGVLADRPELAGAAARTDREPETESQAG